MMVIFCSSALFCLIYYVIIICYSGIGTSFSAIWLVIAGVMGFAALFYRFYLSHRHRIPLWVPVSLVTVLGAFAAVFAVVEILIGVGMLRATRQSMDYVIVLGAQVRGTELSSSLERRLERVLSYADQSSNTVFVLSGGQGKGEEISEARAMYEYLHYNGVPDSQLLLEQASTNTVENIRNSARIIESQEAWKAIIGHQYLSDAYKERADQIQIGVLTSNFHVYRARAIARKQGLSNVHGIAAGSDPVLFLHLCVREGFAILKDKFMGNM